jgi:transcriptional regulator with XRE-family HTH domain
MDMARYGRAIAQRRADTGVTQGEMARRLGVGQNMLSRLETGAAREVPNPEFLAAVERELGLPVVEQLSLIGFQIVSGTGNPFRPGTLKWRVVERMMRDELELYRIQGAALMLDVNPQDHDEVG